MIFFAPEKLLYTRGVSDTLCAWVVQNAQQPKEGGSKKQYKMCKTSKSILQFRSRTILQMRYFEEQITCTCFYLDWKFLRKKYLSPVFASLAFSDAVKTASALEDIEGARPEQNIDDNGHR